MRGKRTGVWFVLGLLGVFSLGLSAVEPGADPEGAETEVTRLASVPQGQGSIQRVRHALLRPQRHYSRPSPDPLEEEMARLEQRLSSHPNDFEAQLLKGLLYFKSGKFEDALSELETLTERAPKFRLAHLIQGDLLLAQTRTVKDIGATPLLGGADHQGLERLDELRREAEVRLRAYLDSLQGRLLPRPLLHLGEDVKTGLMVDKSNHRLFVYRRDDRGRLALVRDFYVSTGKLVGNKTLRGDLKTPEGVYYVTRYIDDRQLPDKYGIGAFPVNYPNELDRHLGKTGDGIWLHGTSSEDYSRPPQDSEGCVVLANLDLNVASDYIEPGRTPVVITDGVQWLAPSRWQGLRREVKSALQAWRRDWESGDPARYLAHYAEGFWAPGHDRESWADYKRRVLRGKSWQEIEIDDLSLFGYPASASNGSTMVVAEFEQDYDSNNFSSTMDKRLYLVREAGAWRVLYEGPQ